LAGGGSLGTSPGEENYSASLWVRFGVVPLLTDMHAARTCVPIPVSLLRIHGDLAASNRWLRWRRWCGHTLARPRAGRAAGDHIAETWCQGRHVEEGARCWRLSELKQLALGQGREVNDGAWPERRKMGSGTTTQIEAEEDGVGERTRECG
jgi:hypothetical protein